MDVSLGLIRTLGVWGFAGFSALGLLLVILPLVDRDGEKKLTRKPIALGVGLLFFLGFLTFWAVGARVDSVPAEAEIEMRILEERVIPPRTGLEAGGDTETPQP